MPARRHELVCATLSVLLPWLAACSRTEVLFPETSNLAVSLADRSLTTQLDDGFNVAVWELDSVVVDLDEPLTYLAEPCVHVQTRILFAGLPFALQCGIRAFVVPAGEPLQATLQVRLLRFELRRAGRPALPDDEDFDGDGVINADDVCPLVPDPDQEDINADGVGDACSLPDSLGELTVPDRDGDGIPDGLDNCLWVPNPDQADTPDLAVTGGTLVADGIGDACPPTIVTFGSQELALGPFEATFESGQFQFVDADFAGTVTCDAGFTQCSFDPAAIAVGIL